MKYMKIILILLGCTTFLSGCLQRELPASEAEPYEAYDVNEPPPADIPYYEDIEIPEPVDIPNNGLSTLF